MVTTKELIHLFEERAVLEDYCGKNYIKLGKIASGQYLNNSYNSFLPFWDCLKDSLDKMSALHITHYHSLHEILKDIHKYSDEQNKQHKNFKDEESSTMQSIQSFILAKNTVNKSQEIYGQRLQEFQKLTTDATNIKDKIQNKLNKSKEEYTNNISKYNKACDTYITNMKKSCQKFQDYEVGHLNKMRTFVLSYAELFCNVAANITQIACEFKKSIENSSLEVMVEKFVELKQTGLKQPEHFTSINYEQSIAPQSSPDSSDLINISPTESICLVNNSNILLPPSTHPLTAVSTSLNCRKFNISSNGTQREGKDVIILPNHVTINNNNNPSSSGVFDKIDPIPNNRQVIDISPTYRFPNSQSFNIDILNDQKNKEEDYDEISKPPQPLNSAAKSSKDFSRQSSLSSSVTAVAVATDDNINNDVNGLQEDLANNDNNNSNSKVIGLKKVNKKKINKFTAKFTLPGKGLDTTTGNNKITDNKTARNKKQEAASSAVAATKISKTVNPILGTSNTKDDAPMSSPSKKQQTNAKKGKIKPNTKSKNTVLSNKEFAKGIVEKGSPKLLEQSNKNITTALQQANPTTTVKSYEKLSAETEDKADDNMTTGVIINVKDLNNKTSYSTVSSQSSNFLKEGFLKKMKRNKIKKCKKDSDALNADDISSIPSKNSSPNDKTLTGDALSSTGKINIMVDKDGYSIRPPDTSISVTTSSDSESDDDNDDDTDDYYGTNKLMKIEIKPLNQQVMVNAGSANQLLSLEELKKSVDKLIISPQLTGQTYRSRQARIRNRNLTRCKSEDLDIQDSASYSVPLDEEKNVDANHYRNLYLRNDQRRLGENYPLKNDRIIIEPLYETPNEPFKRATNFLSSHKNDLTNEGLFDGQLNHLTAVSNNNGRNGLLSEEDAAYEYSLRKIVQPINQAHSRTPIYLPSPSPHQLNRHHLMLRTRGAEEDYTGEGETSTLYDDDSSKNKKMNFPSYGGDDEGAGKKDATLVPATNSYSSCYSSATSSGRHNFLPPDDEHVAFYDTPSSSPFHYFSSKAGGGIPTTAIYRGERIEDAIIAAGSGCGGGSIIAAGSSSAYSTAPEDESSSPIRKAALRHLPPLPTPSPPRPCDLPNNEAGHLTEDTNKRQKSTAAIFTASKDNKHEEDQRNFDPGKIHAFNKDTIATSNQTPGIDNRFGMAHSSDKSRLPKYNALIWLHETLSHNYAKTGDDYKKDILNGTVKLIISPKLKEILWKKYNTDGIAEVPLQSHQHYDNDSRRDSLSFCLDNFDQNNFKILQSNGDFIASTDWISKTLKIELDCRALALHLLNISNPSSTIINKMAASTATADNFNSDADQHYFTRSRLNSTSGYLEDSCYGDNEDERASCRHSNLSDSLSSLSDVASTYSTSNFSCYSADPNTPTHNAKNKKYHSIDLIKYLVTQNSNDSAQTPIIILPVDLSTTWKHNPSTKTVELRVLYNVNNRFINRLEERLALTMLQNVGNPCVFSEFEIYAFLNVFQPNRIQAKPHSIWEPKSKRLRWKVPQLLNVWPSGSVMGSLSTSLPTSPNNNNNTSHFITTSTTASTNTSNMNNPSKVTVTNYETLPCTVGALRAKYEYVTDPTTLLGLDSDSNVLKRPSISETQPVFAKFHGKGVTLTGVSIFVVDPPDEKNAHIDIDRNNHRIKDEQSQIFKRSLPLHLSQNNSSLSTTLNPSSFCHLFRLAVKMNFSSGKYLADSK